MKCLLYNPLSLTSIKALEAEKEKLHSAKMNERRSDCVGAVIEGRLKLMLPSSLAVKTVEYSY